MKLADIPPGSDLPCRCAAKQIAEQVEFELETCRRLLAIEPEKVLELLANTPGWSVFLGDEDLQAYELISLSLRLPSEEDANVLHYLRSTH